MKKTQRIFVALLMILLTLCIIACEGPAGPAGTDGIDGVDGVNGTNGTNGTNGANGQDGKDGKNAPITLWLNTFPVILAYADGTPELSEARVMMIQDALKALAASTNGSDMTAVSNLTGRGNGNITIIIEDVPEYTTGNAHYRVKDGRTAYIRYERVTTATSVQLNATMLFALREMSNTALPALE